MAEPTALELLKQSFGKDPNALDLLRQSFSSETTQPQTVTGQESAMTQLDAMGFGSQQAVASQPQNQGVTSTGVESYPVSPEEERQAWLREQIQTGNIEPTPPSFWEKLRGEIPQMAGEEVGAAAGAYGGARAAARLPAGHPLLKGGLIVGGAILGAAGGAMGGKGFQQAYRMTRPGSKSMSIGDIYKEQMLSGVEGAVSEALGRGFVAGGTKALKTGVGKKLLAPVKEHLTPGIEKLDAILKQAGRTLPPEEAAQLTAHARKLLAGNGSFLAAAQKTQVRPVDFIENAVEQSMFGGNRLFQLKRFLQPVTYKHAVKEMSDRFWKEAGEKLSPAEAGEMFINTVTRERGAQRSFENLAYKQIGEVTQRRGKNLIPDLANTHAIARQIEKTAKAMGGSGQQKQMQALAKRVQKMKYEYAPDANYFLQGHKMRSSILEEVRSMEAKEGRTLARARGAAKHIAASIDSAMEATAKKAGPREYTAWRAANKFTKDGAKILDSEAINGAMRLARRKPELLTGAVFTKHGTQQLKAVKGAVDTKTYDTLFASYLDDVMTKNSGLAYETRMVPSGTRILDHMDKNLGEDMMQEMFKTPGHLQDFLDVMNLGFVLERKNQAGGGMLIQMLQAGGIADIGAKGLSGEAPKTASWAITMGPAVLGRIFANPTGAKWLSTGFKLTGSQQQKWFAKIPPSIARIVREGTQVEPTAKKKQKKQFSGQPRGGGF